jgi:plasmid stability protein
MARLTVTLSDERHRQLKVRAALQGKTIGQLIEGALVESEERHRQEALAILAKARANAAKARPKLTDEELMDLAVEETYIVRRQMAEERGAARHS